MHCKILGVVATVSLVLGGIQFASAADMPARPIYKAAPMPAPAWSWTGFYVGVHAGYGGDRNRYPFTVLGLDGVARVTSSGGFAGGQAGFNWQTGDFVLGVEADAAWSDITGEVAASIAGLSISAGTRMRWFGTARGRVGYAMDRFMIYGTGGYAYGQSNTFLNLGAFAFSKTNDKSGWTAGGGFEYALLNNLSVKTEYLYLDFGTDTVFTSPVFTIREHPTAHTIKAGLNWRFM